jgi:hypothetical protein
MSIGSSGRIVIEVEPESKRQLYAALARDGLTLKDWFLKNAELYLTESGQLPLSFSKGSSAAKTDSKSESDKPPISGVDA